MQKPLPRELAPLVLELAHWMTERTLHGAPDTEIVGGLCERLVRAGMPLVRGQIGIDTLHPLIGGKVVRWWRGEGVEVSHYDREASNAASPVWVSSPYYTLVQTGAPRYRFRYPKEVADYPYAILAELAPKGVTDYVAYVHRLGEAATVGELDGTYSSFASDAAEGFSDRDLELLDAIGPFLASALTTSAFRQIPGTLVETYLGRDAGARVLRGAIARGIAERIRAVIWFSDLKGFTSMVDAIDPALIVPLLNDYAEPQVSAIQAAGGTVLKFIGDGILAIFPVGEDLADACHRSLAAAEAAFGELAQVSTRRAAAGLPMTSAYLALHVGEVFYGNIGGADRLDFTVIGPAVNEASRLSALCRSLEQDIVVSQAFAEGAKEDQARLVSLGRYALRGVARAQTLFTLDPETRKLV